MNKYVKEVNMIRNIKVEDAKDLSEIIEKSLNYDCDRSEVEKRIEKIKDSKNHFILVYQDDETEKILGYIHAEVYETLYMDSGFNILALAVLPEFQNQKIGKKLIQEIENEAIKRKFKFIRLNSGEQRVNAHIFYEKCGYLCERLQKRFIKYF